MGEAKRRRAEIERLKSMTSEEAAAWRQEKEDEAALRRGIDPEATMTDPVGVVAMARRLHNHFEQAKTTQNVDDAIQYLYKKVDATIHELRDIPIACGKGCSHCCIIWVTVTAPEAIYTGKRIAAVGAVAIERVRAANEVTRHFEFDVRDQHPHDCPMLQNQLCSIYEDRPTACRQAASGDADVCARSYRNLTDEGIPTPAMYIGSRAAYATALHAALAHSSLSNGYYELNAAVTRFLDTPNAEQRWLAGEDIFAGVLGERNMPPQMADQIDFVSHEAFDV